MGHGVVFCQICLTEKSIRVTDLCEIFLRIVSDSLENNDLFILKNRFIYICHYLLHFIICNFISKLNKRRLKNPSNFKWNKEVYEFINKVDF